MIFNEMFDSLTSQRATLYFIEYDYRLSLDKVYLELKLKLEKKEIKIGYIIEKLDGCLGCNGKVYQDVAFIFVFGKLFNNCGFSNSSGALDQ